MMSKRTYVYPYKMGSESAKNLAKALDIKRIRTYNSRYRPKEGDTIINWGSSTLPQRIVDICSILNPPELVSLCCNKLSFFEWFKAQGFEGISIPRFTTVREEALDFECERIVCRHTLTGHSGKGIELIENNGDIEDNLPYDVPLYVEYMPKTREYRLHMWQDDEGNVEIFDIQRKVRDPEKEPLSWQIRSHQNGFIFVRKGVEVDENTSNAVKNVFRTLGLSFGAVDLIFSKGVPYILEINTAPALTGQTLENYKNLFENL